MANVRVVRLSLPSSVDLLDLVQRVTEETARIAGFPEDDQLDLGLAVREGTVNAMKHGHAFDIDQLVEVRFSSNCERFEISVRDRGPGFDPRRIPDPTEPGNLWKSSGRGLLLIRSLVDEMDFRAEDPGVTLVLVKMRRATPDGRREGTGRANA